MTNENPQAGQSPAISTTPVRVFRYCGSLGCLEALRVGTPTAVASLEDVFGHEGWTVAAGDIWCPKHEALGAHKLAFGCDECEMPGGHHRPACLRRVELRPESFTRGGLPPRWWRHAAVVGASEAERLQRESSEREAVLEEQLVDAKRALSALLLPAGHVQHEGPECTGECQHARRVLGIDGERAPQVGDVVPAKVPQSLREEAGFRRGEVVFLGASTLVPRRVMMAPPSFVLGMEDAGPGREERLKPSQSYQGVLERVARVLAGPTADVWWKAMTPGAIWERLSPILARLKQQAADHAGCAARVDGLASELTAALEAERTARAAVTRVRAGLPDVWLYQGDGTDMPATLTCPVVMPAERLRRLLEAAPGSATGPLSVSIADAIRTRDLLGVSSGGMMAPAVEGLREVLMELSGSHLELHDWDAQSAPGEGLQGAGRKAFGDIGRQLRAATVLLHGRGRLGT